MYQSKFENIPIPPRNPRRSAIKAYVDLHSNEFSQCSALVDNDKLSQSILHKLQSTGSENCTYRQDPSDTFQESSAGERTQSHHRDYEEVPIAYQPSYQPASFTRLDHLIAQHGGRTSSLDYLPGHMNREKMKRLSREEELFEVKKENGRLRAEVAYLKSVQQSLMKLHAETVEAYRSFSTTTQNLKEALQHSAQKLGIAERDFLRFWDISTDPNEDKEEEQNFF